MSVKPSVSLSQEQHDFARALVEQGRYGSVNAVVQQGIELLRQRETAEPTEAQALKALLTYRREGAFVSGEQMDARIAEMAAAARRAHGLSDWPRFSAGRTTSN